MEKRTDHPKPMVATMYKGHKLIAPMYFLANKKEAKGLIKYGYKLMNDKYYK